jgi:hypothetical protein
MSALALVAAVLAQAAAAEDSPIPLVSGSFWEYRESYAEQHAGVAAIEETTTRFAIHLGRRGFYVTQRGGADPASGPVERGDGWIRLLPWTGEDALPLPLELGRVGRGSSAEHEGWKVEAEEEVTVPAGTFKALRCAIRSWTQVSLLWIVPGVGVVKETQGAPGRIPEIERVLLRWRRGG